VEGLRAKAFALRRTLHKMGLPAAPESRIQDRTFVITKLNTDIPLKQDNQSNVIDPVYQIHPCRYDYLKI
jgi:hypothetical protein